MTENKFIFKSEELNKLSKKDYFFAWFKCLTEIEQGIIKILFSANHPLPIKEIKNKFVLDIKNSLGAITHKTIPHQKELHPLFIKTINLNPVDIRETFSQLLKVDNKLSYNEQVNNMASILSKKGLTIPSPLTIKKNLERLENNIVKKRNETIRGSNELWYLNPDFNLILNNIDFKKEIIKKSFTLN